MSDKKNIPHDDSNTVAWVLIALLAALFVIFRYVNESFKSDALYVAFVVTLVALAFIGFRNRQDR